MTTTLNIRNTSLQFWLDREFEITDGSNRVLISPAVARAFRDFVNQVDALEAQNDGSAMPHMKYNPSNHRQRMEYSIPSKPEVSQSSSMIAGGDFVKTFDFKSPKITMVERDNSVNGDADLVATAG